MTRRSRPFGGLVPLKLVPIAAVTCCYLMVNFVYGLYPRSLNGVRGVWSFWLIAGAASLWPLLTPGPPVRLFFASWATVGLFLWLVPIWSGHGDWPPDLGSLFFMVLAGGVASGLAAKAPTEGHVADGRAKEGLVKEGHRRVVALILLVALAASVVWSWPPARASTHVRAPMTTPADHGPALLWKETLWTDVWTKLLPMLHRPRAARPFVAMLGPDRVLVAPSVERAELREARTGKILTTLDLALPGSAGARAGAGSANLPLRFSPAHLAAEIWRRARVQGDLCALDAPNAVGVLSLSSGKPAFWLEGLDPRDSLLLPDGMVALVGREMRRYDIKGQVVWSLTLPAGPTDRPEPARFSYAPGYHGGPVHLASLPRGGGPAEGGIPTPDGDAPAFAGLSTGGVVVADGAGHKLWEIKSDLFFVALTASPQHPLVYAAGYTPEGRSAVAAYAGGKELWRRILPQGTHAFDWAALPSGLVVVHSRSVDAAGNSPPAQGQSEARRVNLLEFLDPETGVTRWSLEGPSPIIGDLWPLEADGGQDLLVVSSESAERVSAADGKVLWRHATQDGRPTLEYYLEPVYAGSQLLIPGSSLMHGVDPRNGRLLWVYSLPGAWLSASAENDVVVLGSSRQIAAFQVGAGTR